MTLKRVFAGFYTRYDGRPIFVVRVLKDIDTGESIVVCKDAGFTREDNEHFREQHPHRPHPSENDADHKRGGRIQPYRHRQYAKNTQLSVRAVHRHKETG